MFRSSLKILRERKIADWIALSATLPFFLSVYFVGSGRPYYALLAGILAFVCDSLDGVVARKLGQASAFGRQLDSSMDALIYLVFQGYFVLVYMNFNFVLTLVSVSVVLAFGIMRLIRFNDVGFVYNKKGQIGYPGLGTAYIFPAVITLYLLAEYLDAKFLYLTVPMLLVLSWAMISEHPIGKPRLWLWYPFALACSLLLLNLIRG